MRKVALCGVMLFASLFLVAPAAQASDASIREVVITHAQRQVKEDQRFIKAMQKLSTRAQLKKAKAAAGRQAELGPAVARRAQRRGARDRADRRGSAKKRMLDALDLYNKGIRRLQKGINQALRQRWWLWREEGQAGAEEHAHRLQAHRRKRPTVGRLSTF